MNTTIFYHILLLCITVLQCLVMSVASDVRMRMKNAHDQPSHLHHGIIKGNIDDDPSNAAQKVKVKVDTTRIVHKIEESFVSYALDFELLTNFPHWPGLNFSSHKLQTLVSALSPSILRLGGSGSSYSFFDAPRRAFDAARLKPTPVLLEKDDVVKLVTFTRAVGARLLLDLDIQLRFGEQWDPTNAIRLMDFCAAQGYGENVDFELGNEPSYPAAGQLKLTDSQIANDFATLYRVIRSYDAFAHSRLVGPDIVEFPSVGSNSYKIVQAIVNVTGSYLTAVTFHQYYFQGDIAKYTKYLDPSNFDVLAKTIDAVQYAVTHSKYPRTPLWLGETSDSWHGGTVNVSDRFVSSFLWLDKLGLSARMGVSVVIRQVLFGSNYSLINFNMDPNPDYWISFVHKTLVGTEVLDVITSSSNLAPIVRVYSHCTRTSTTYKSGAVTAFAVNISPNVSSSLVFETPELSLGRIDLYLLKPGTGEGIGSVLSKDVLLNGRLMKMASETSMPGLVPITLPAGQSVDVPPLSLAFLVFPDAHFSVCVHA